MLPSSLVANPDYYSAELESLGSSFSHLQRWTPNLSSRLVRFFNDLPLNISWLGGTCRYSGVLIPRFELERLRWTMHQIFTLQQRLYRIFGLSGSRLQHLTLIPCKRLEAHLNRKPMCYPNRGRYHGGPWPRLSGQAEPTRSWYY